MHAVVAGFVRPFTSIRGAHRLCRAINTAFLDLGAPPVRVARAPDGARIVVDLRSATEWYTYYSGRYDEAEIELIKRLLSERGDFLDVGGNIGIYAVRVGRLLAQSGRRVYCFEPVPSNLQRIRQNVKLNQLDDVVSVYDVALSSVEGAVEIVLREDFESGAETGNASIAISPEADGAFRRINVRCLPFDLARQEYNIGKISVLKVDIEGHEDQFLLGARNLLNVDRPIIFSEVNVWYFEKRGVDIESTLGGALPAHYRRFRMVDGHGALEPFERFSELHRFANVVFCPDDRIEELFAAMSRRSGKDSAATRQ
jgi:FkbM family methyltransferase